jgi:hypothetical protein
MVFLSVDICLLEYTCNVMFSGESKYDVAEELVTSIFRVEE